MILMTEFQIKFPCIKLGRSVTRVKEENSSERRGT